MSAVCVCHCGNEPPTLTTRHRRTPALAALAAAVALLGGAAPDGATAIPSGFTDTLVASVPGPTALAFTPDGRLLVGTQYGAVRIVQDGTLLTAPAVDLGSNLCTGNEQGLLGAAVDPAFASNGYVYLYLTRNKSGTCVNRVSRFTMTGSTIGAATETVLIDEIPSPSGNHNGGDLKFGRDGYLYISVGDGACDYAGGGCYGQNDAARDRHTLVGKILRIASDGSVPSPNPFQGAGTARCNVTGGTTSGTTCREIFATGLRNPFRIAFDPNDAGTRFFVNDVGDGAWEEVDEGAAGADYGWNVREGPCANGSYTNCGPPPAGLTNPVHAYSHAESSCHAITGGAFVPNGTWPAAYDGAYLYGDYTCGKIFQLSPAAGGGFTRSEFATGVGAVVNMLFGPSPQGQALYYTNYTGGGQVRRIEPTESPNRAPTARLSASPTSGPVPLAVTFDGGASTDPDAGDTLTYTWDFGDGSAPETTASATTSHSYGAAGSFTATLTVRDAGGATSAPATVEIQPGNTAPQVTIDAPAVSDRFAVGDEIVLHATATDAEDGAFGPASLTWRAVRHHDEHTHPFLAPTTGNDIAITQPQPEDLGSGIEGYLEVEVTATDSQGLATTVTREVRPRKVDVTFATDPAGLQVVVNGTAATAPATFTSWEAHAISVDAPAQADEQARTWSFHAWSDGGAASHSLVTPAAATMVTATFVQAAARPGLVAAYGFDAGSGTAVADASGQGNGGTISGASWTAAGKHGSALSFDGADDWVTVPDSASLDLTTGVTVAAWVRPTALGGWRTVAVKERAGGIVYALYADQAGGKPNGQVYLGGEHDALGPAAPPTGAWTHLATTFDGAALRLYVDGALASSTPVSGSLAPSDGVLRIGGNSIWGEWFAGLIDDLRVYDRPLSNSEIQSDMATPVGAAQPAPDTTPPTPPTGLAATSAIGTATVQWNASTDAVGVVRYNVHRSMTAGFAPSAANRVGQPTGTSHADTGLAPGTHHYRVSAEDATGNVSAYSAELAVVVPADGPPSVSVTAPASGATVSGSVTVSASASDDVSVAGVQFRMDGAPLGVEDTSAPYLVSWDTTGVANGTHTLTAVARDGAGQTATSASVSVTVSNAAPPPSSGLVAAFSFDAVSGSSVADLSGRGNHGTVSGASWSPSGRYGSALSFDGVNDWVTAADHASLDLTTGMTLSAWVRPAALGAWRTVIFKERPGGIVYSLFASQGGSLPVGQVFLGGERDALGSVPLPVNAWSHFAATFDGLVVQLYVNGTLAGSKAYSGSMSPSTGVLRIGGNSVWGEWFSGLIDDVRVYDRPLSSTEIQQDMTTPVGGAAPPSSDAPPSVSVTAPASGATVSGSVTVSASASDDVSVAGVQFRMDGAPLGVEDTSAPYLVSWDTTGVANGTHTLTAVARDGAGQTATSASVSVTVSNAAPPPSSGLVAAFSFDAVSGSSVADLSGRGNHGTVSGASWSPSGRYGSALSFDGVNDWVTAADHASLDLTTGMTLSAWVRPAALGAWRTVIFKERPGGIVYSLFASQGGSLPVGQVFLGGERDALGSVPLPVNAWSHFAATFDGLVVQLYVNGTLAGSKAYSGSMSPSTGVLRIGGNSVWGEWFSGLIDDVRVYDRPLSSTEIQQDMTTPVG